MVAYSFRERFVPAIRARRKRNTIRAPRAEPSRHVRPEELVQLYTGMRTKACALIIPPTPCIAVTPIRLNFAVRSVKIKGRPRLHMNQELNEFARMDGFEDWHDLRAFFAGLEVFEGVFIEW